MTNKTQNYAILLVTCGIELPSPKFHCHNDRERNKKKKTTNGAVMLLCALFGSLGYWSGGGITHSSPLNIILLGNAHPSLKVKISESFWRRISVWTFPLSPDVSNKSL